MYGMFRILKTELEQSVGALEESVLTFSEFKK
jgi:hypothetical protein